MMRSTPTYRRGRDYYSEAGDRGGLAGVFRLLLVVVFLCIPPALVCLSENEHYVVLSSLQQLLEEHPIQELSPTSSRTAHKEDIVHLHAKIDNVSVQDDAMGVSLPNALQLRRVTQYCQWKQHQSTTCQTCERQIKAKDGSIQTEPYDCHCITSYHYIKAWRNHRISSLFFDQPGAHQNPQRDPLPSQTFVPPLAEFRLADDTQEEVIVVDDSILRNLRGTLRRVEWNWQGSAPRAAWWLPSWLLGPRSDTTTRYEDIQQLHTQHGSSSHSFVYVGDGYFFSPFQESHSQQLFKYLQQYMEGSLLDWQLGDIMPSCTAGDVRIFYQVMDPTTVSIIGQVQETTPTISLHAFQGTTTRAVGMIHPGIVNVPEMFKTEERGSWWQAMLPRVLLVPWSTAIMNLGMALLFGRRVVGLVGVLVGTASVWLGAMGLVWWHLWGTPHECQVYLAAAAVLWVWAMARSNCSPGGLRAVWCILGRWAHTPPSWRVEDSYEGEAQEQVYSQKKHI